MDKTPWDDLLEALEFDHATAVLRAMLDLARDGVPHEEIQEFLGWHGWCL